VRQLPLEPGPERGGERQHSKTKRCNLSATFREVSAPAMQVTRKGFSNVATASNTRL
jgi:hypothetical protein